MLSHCSGQLTGNGGVFRLPAGEQYRDAETLQASERVSAFAKRVQPALDIEAELNMLGERERHSYRPKRKLPPVFFSSHLPTYGRKMAADLFYYEQSKKIVPPQENKDRIEKEWVGKSEKQNNEPEMRKQNIQNKTNAVGQKLQGRTISTRQLIANSGNLWQHLSRSRNNAENYEIAKYEEPLLEYQLRLPSYQRLHFIEIR